MRRALPGLLLVLLVAGCGGTDDQAPEAATPIRIGTKNFTEQRIVGELYRQALERAGFPVALKTDIGSTEITHEALRGGAIDMYPEYIGVLLSEVARVRDRPRDPAAALKMASDFERLRGFRVLAASPFSDSNAVAVLPAFAGRYRLQRIGDLARVPGGATVAAPPEFRTRVEGLVGLQDEYGLRNLKVEATPIGGQYAALDREKVDAAAVFTTDGQLSEKPYVVLRDPKRLFALQHLAPIVSAQIVRKYGRRFTDAVDRVTRSLTTRAMRRMNADVDLRGQTPAAVARRFLSGR